jgi:hypothetical protein
MTAADLREAGRPGFTKRTQMILAWVYASAVAGLLIWVLPRTRATLPIILILLGLPLIFRLVPRNYLYGMRSPRTLWTDEETWYRQNTIAGVVMVAVGGIWLVVLALWN